MNAKIIELNFKTPFPDIEHAREAIVILSHTIIFYRSTGHYRYKNVDNKNNTFQISAVGLCDDESSKFRMTMDKFCNFGSNQFTYNQDCLSTSLRKSPVNIPFQFLRVNCEELDRYIKQHVLALDSEDLTSFYLSFYKRVKKPTTIFTDLVNNNQANKQIWEQYKFTFCIEDQDYFGDDIDLNDPSIISNDNDETKIQLGKELEQLIFKIVNIITVDSDYYIPSNPDRKENLDTVFFTNFYECQPYLFKFSVNADLDNIRKSSLPNLEIKPRSRQQSENFTKNSTPDVASRVKRKSFSGLEAPIVVEKNLYDVGKKLFDKYN